MSAFARAKLASQPAKNVETDEIETSALAPIQQQEAFATSIGATPYNGHHSDELRSSPVSDDDIVIETKSPPKSAPDVRLSSFVPTPDNSIEYSDEEVHFKLPHNKSVVFVGEYDLQVLQGIVTVYGAILHASNTVHRVYAPSTHALPAIVARRGDAELVLWPPRKTMQGLGRVSPLFRRIWAGKERMPTFMPVSTKR